jgi:hypothetical protein
LYIFEDSVEQKVPVNRKFHGLNLPSLSEEARKGGKVLIGRRIMTGPVTVLITSIRIERKRERERTRERRDDAKTRMRENTE